MLVATMMGLSAFWPITIGTQKFEIDLKEIHT